MIKITLMKFPNRILATTYIFLGISFINASSNNTKNHTQFSCSRFCDTVNASVMLVDSVLPVCSDLGMYSVELNFIVLKSNCNLVNEKIIIKVPCNPNGAIANKFAYQGVYYLKLNYEFTSLSGVKIYSI